MQGGVAKEVVIKLKDRTVRARIISRAPYTFTPGVIAFEGDEAKLNSPDVDRFLSSVELTK